MKKSYKEYKEEVILCEVAALMKNLDLYFNTGLLFVYGCLLYVTIIILQRRWIVWQNIGKFSSR